MKGKRRAGFDRVTVPTPFSVLAVIIDCYYALNLHADGHVTNAGLGVLAAFDKVDVILPDTFLALIDSVVAFFYGFGVIAEKVDHTFPFAVVLVIAVESLQSFNLLDIFESLDSFL